MVRRPRVFLFDEPLSNLDGPMRLQMRAELSKLHRRLGATMLYVTHDQAEAMMLGNRLAVMEQGVIQQVATPLELYRHPANLFVAAFIGSPPMNFFAGQLARSENALMFQAQGVEQSLNERGTKHASLPLTYAGKRVVFGIRPENIVVQIEAGAVPPGQTLEAIVELVEPAGPETFLHLSIGAHTFVARAGSSCAAKADERVPVAFDMRAAHFFEPETGKVL